MVNVDLLRETLDHIKNNPQTWRQDVWFTHVDPETGFRTDELISFDVEEVNSCGTAFCFAGHAALKSGFVAPPKNSYSHWCKEEYDEASGRTRTIFVDDHAAKALGITWDQADVLFSGENSMEDLETIVNAIIEDPDISGSELNGLVDRNEDEDYDDYDDDEDCSCCRDDEW